MGAIIFLAQLLDEEALIIFPLFIHSYIVKIVQKVIHIEYVTLVMFIASRQIKVLVGLF